MKTIKLLRLRIQNFKGIINFEYTFDPEQTTSIFGDNGTGKSTTMDAWLWLLFGKDSSGKSDTSFAIKTILTESVKSQMILMNMETLIEDLNIGDVIPRIDHIVEADLLINDKTVVKLTRNFKEKWGTKRGDIISTFSGHETIYHVDDVPKSKKEYDSIISDMIDEETFKLLTNPMHFNSLPWEKRRDVLISISDKVS